MWWWMSSVLNGTAKCMGRNPHWHKHCTIHYMWTYVYGRNGYLGFSAGKFNLSFLLSEYKKCIDIGDPLDLHSIYNRLNKNYKDYQWFVQKNTPDHNIDRKLWSEFYARKEVQCFYRSFQCVYGDFSYPTVNKHCICFACRCISRKLPVLTLLLNYTFGYAQNAFFLHIHFL